MALKSGPESAADASFRYQEIYRPLDGIPSRERTAIVLFYMEGQSA